MEKVIVFSDSDGGVAVIVPSPWCGLTVEEIAAKDVPQGVAFSIVEAASLPADRVFRNAWTKAGGLIVEDVPKSKALAHIRRRAKRAEELMPLDIEATIQAKAVAAEAARQVIRDKNAGIQARIDGATGAATLRAELAAL